MSEQLHRATPKISVIIPHYNMAAYLSEAVRSVAHQDYDNSELIIVDDGSREQPDWDRLMTIASGTTRIIKAKHAGKSTAVNQGFKTASGHYLVILDADDLLPEHSLSARASTMQAGADLCIGSFSIICGGTIRVRQRLNNIRNKTNRVIINKYLNGLITPFHQNAMMFNRKLLDRAGGMDPDMIRGQDKDFAIRLLLQSRNTVFIEQSVYQYRRYDRPLKQRLCNRCLGSRYSLVTIHRYIPGPQKFWYSCQHLIIDAIKLFYNFFGVYKGWKGI